MVITLRWASLASACAIVATASCGGDESSSFGPGGSEPIAGAGGDGGTSSGKGGKSSGGGVTSGGNASGGDGSGLDAGGDSSAGTANGGAPAAGAGGDPASGGAGGDTSSGGIGGTGALGPCGWGRSYCDDACMPTAVDPNNCGDCGTACLPSEVCVSNGCTDDCPAGLTECNGTCVDLAFDNDNCNACGEPCDSGEGCVNGSCVDAVPVGTAPAKCEDGGPPIVFDTPGTEPICSGSIADNLLWALCTCDDIGLPQLSSAFLADGFDSSEGPYVPYGLGASVGTNGDLNYGSDFSVYGDVWTAGEAGLVVNGAMDVHQALRVRNGLNLKNELDVDSDATIGGPYSGTSNGTILGSLETPDCSSLPSGLNVAGACIETATDVPNPCKCEPEDLLPLADIVSHYANPANNDNSLIGLDPAALSTDDHPAALVLPCGIYYLDSILASSPISISVEGRAALIVGGSIQVSASLAFSLTPTSTLDVVVGGTLVSSGTLRFGSPAYPALTRFYIAGVSKPEGEDCTLNADCWSLSCSGDQCASGSSTIEPFSVYLSSGSTLNGGFYAPNGAFIGSGSVEVYGAIFADDYHASSDTKIHYDQAFVKQGDTCTGGTGGMGGAGGAGGSGGSGGCGSCLDCGSQACIDGECSACTSNAQCCAPLYCVQGTCKPDTCAGYGQLCQESSDCCSEVPCTNGVCKYPPQ